ncbi:hemin uptake protein HemP [Aminobacter sp. AP02]|uniref:hemin uptake protein HemP n=1 Tax=Aminobacter sp. AP02 TaxID=2135737 RepID=UPI000D6AAA65|nr:hemin uptake protein HemP [Aminobacter sp. AP02]
MPVRPMAGTLAVRTLTSESLFLGDFEIGIDHGGALYRLKITRQGKLILNK